MEQKLQVDIATKIYSGEQKIRTCIISTFQSVHLPSFMSKDQTVFKLPQDPDFADGRQSDRRTHGRRVNLKFPPVKHR